MTIKQYIFLGILLLIIILIVHGFYKRLKLLRMFENAYYKINNLGYVIAISGAIRSGKTTLTAGLTHLLTLKLQQDLQSDLQDIKEILIDINFIELNNFIKADRLTVENYKENLENFVLSFLHKDDLDNYEFTHKLGDPYFDYLDYKNKIILLEKYVECYINLHRTHFVLSNIKIYNHLTASYSLDFNNIWIKLKEKQDFPLRKYSIFVEDDKLVKDSNIGYAKRLHEDSGSDIFFRLFGHIFEEKSFYLTTVQNVERWIKLEREIAQKHIYVFDSAVVGNYPKLNFLLNIYKMLWELIYWFCKKIYKNDKYYNNKNFFKKRFYKINQIRKKLFSKSFVFFNTGLYTNIEKVGKEINPDDRSSEMFPFILPLNYVYGVLNTHEFNVLWKYLYDRSNLKYSDLKETKIDEAEIINILQKYNDKLLEPNSNISSNLEDYF